MSSIYIPSLPSFFDDFSLQKLFRDFGQIKECRVIQHDTLLKASGFVKFFNSKCAKLAASKKDQTVIERSAIRVFVIWDTKETLSTIRVSNLPKGIHASDLQYLFLPCGDIVNVSLKKTEESTQACVSFSRVEYAIRACEEMNDAVFGPSNENLCVELANAEARYFKWKRNGFEYIRNPWSEQSISSQKSTSAAFNISSSSPNGNHNQMWNGCFNQIVSASSQEQLYNQSPIQSCSWQCPLPDVTSNDNLASHEQVSANAILTSSPTPSVRSAASSVSLQSSSSSSSLNTKNMFVDNTTSMKSFFNSATMTGCANNIDIENVPTVASDNNVLPSNQFSFQSTSSILPQEQNIPHCGFFGSLFLAPINSQCVMPLPVYSNIPWLDSNLTSFSSLTPNAAPFSNNAPSSSLQTFNVNQSPNHGKESVSQQPSISLKNASGQSSKAPEVPLSSSCNVKRNKQVIWTKEEQELGNLLFAKLESKYPKRCGKLVGMILTENRIKNIKFVNENEKTFYDKVAAFNKLLDDSS